MLEDESAMVKNVSRQLTNSGVLHNVAVINCTYCSVAACIFQQTTSFIMVNVEEEAHKKMHIRKRFFIRLFINAR